MVARYEVVMGGEEEGLGIAAGFAEGI